MYKILTVDDEPHILDILKIFLSKSGFEVMPALGGEKAIEALRSGVKFDLVLLDMKMPRVKGVDVLRAMKKMNKKIPVVILSGSIDVMEKHGLEFKELGYPYIDFLIKPVDLNELLNKVKKTLGSNPEEGK